MNINDHFESPMLLKISFNKLIEKYEQMVDHDDEFISKKAQRVIDAQKPYPELREGICDVKLLDKYRKEIKIILEDSFSEVLTHNEIKTVSVPFHDFIFNSSERFKKIIKTAGKDFHLKILNMPEDDRYIIACTIILNFCYGYDLSFKRPFFYKIPDANGIMRYYKILYNADFTEIIPTKKAKKITQDDIDDLLDNFENIDMWKEKFPPHSYIFKGFVISNIFDVTDDQSISNIKSNLISEGKRKDSNFMKNFHEIFQSLLNIKNLKVGFSIYNKENDSFLKVHGEGMESFLLDAQEASKCDKTLCKYSYKTLLKDKKYYSISDVDKYYKMSKGKAPQYKTLKDQGIKSAILAPIANDTELLGILELVSSEPKVLNSVNANKLTDVMPYILAAVERSKKEEENLIEAVIQQECTSIHPSVHWKFKSAALEFIKNNIIENKYIPFQKIAFENVYPLFGQMDVKGSSNSRNQATQKDLTSQLSLAEKIISQVLELHEMPIYEQAHFQITSLLNELNKDFKVDSEHQTNNFFSQELDPLLKLIQKNHPELNEEVEGYFSKVDSELGVIYFYRKNYDDTIKLINENMSSMLDNAQKNAQAMYPHFFERYKTDGVEHNMYIGEAITRESNFELIYLYNLRLWQIQIMCEMENAFYQNQHEYPLSLDVASMILVFNQPLTIGFRMDEKQFDVDGTYNARYEVVKKRVDKAYIKGSEERVTEKGKLSIVYSQKEDEEEYMNYVRFFQHKKMLSDDAEIVELEDLQGVTGLKAIKVSILYHDFEETSNYYTYDDLVEIIKN
ncbi:MAG: GAF domain-containing protein [Flavobacteriaceae bacterium]|nr:GAF domain-containing protein [Flavobacteriaceae bacterium]